MSRLLSTHHDHAQASASTTSSNEQTITDDNTGPHDESRQLSGKAPPFHPTTFHQTDFENEDIEYVKSILNNILKYNGSVFSIFVFYIIKYGVHNGIKHYLKNNLNQILCTIPLHLQSVWERDVYDNCVETIDYTEDNTTLYTLMTPYGTELRIIVKDSQYSMRNACFTNLDCIMMTRSGFKIHCGGPNKILFKPAPFTELLDELVYRKEFTWNMKLLNILETSDLGIHVVYDHWKDLMKLGLTNKHKIWHHPVPREMREHLSSEKYICSICLDECQEQEHHHHQQQQQKNEHKHQEKKSTRPVCRRSNLNDFIVLPCRHIFHKHCFGQIKLNKSSKRIACPLCRVEYDVSEL
tara:strand:- start:2620 stop:3678 length:1059 start_codon:yes stop_codon:yes gene_type:complete